MSVGEPATRPIPSLLTVVITTSPTPTAPSTELLSSVIQSFHSHCPALVTCSVVVVFDTYEHIAPKARLKKGQATVDVASSYEKYKRNVKELVLGTYAPENGGRDLTLSRAEAEYGAVSSHGVPGRSIDLMVSRTADGQVTFVEPAKRLGFGLAVRSALRLVGTPFVWTHQHDWVLVHSIPIHHILPVMLAHENDEQKPVKYVCLPSVRLLRYADNADVTESPALKALSLVLKGDFALPSDPETSVPLTPFFHWHDKPHIACTSHYLGQVFPHRMSMLRGSFIEDTVGPQARAEMQHGGWRKWACWLYYPDDGKQLCLRHLQGRTWKGTEGARRQAAYWRSRNDAENTVSVSPSPSPDDEDEDLQLARLEGVEMRALDKGLELLNH